LRDDCRVQPPLQVLFIERPAGPCWTCDFALATRGRWPPRARVWWTIAPSL